MKFCLSIPFLIICCFFSSCGSNQTTNSKDNYSNSGNATGENETSFDTVENNFVGIWDNIQDKNGNPIPVSKDNRIIITKGEYYFKIKIGSYQVPENYHAITSKSIDVVNGDDPMNIDQQTGLLKNAMGYFKKVK